MAKKIYTNAIIGPFVFSHVHLSSPDTEGKYADNKYKVDGVAEAASKAIEDAKAVLEQHIKACGLPKKGLNLPLKKEQEKNEAGKKVETGKLFIRAKSNRAPAIVDASGNPIPEKALKKLKIGPGSEGRLEGYFSDYVTTEKVRNADGEIETTEIKGISFTLTGVQLLKLVKGGGQGSSFGAYEGGGFSYEGDDDDDTDQDDVDVGSDASDDDDDGGLDI